MSDVVSVGGRSDFAAAERDSARINSILIVEDDDDIRALAAEILQADGHHVLCARTVEILRKNPRISTLFTDIEMPGMGGEELADLVMASCSGISVIFTSGRHRPRGNVPFLRKPYRPADLIRVVAARCQRRWKTKPHGGGIVGQFGIVFSDGRDRVSALARALTG